MLLQEHYLTLLLAKTQKNMDEDRTVTIDELADIFCCTERNAKFIVKKLVESGYITWNAGRGRGNHSTVAFLQELEAVALPYFRELLRRGNVHTAISFLQHHTLPLSVKGRLQEIMENHFGFQIEQTDTERRDVLRIPYRRRMSTLHPSFITIATEAHFAKQIFDTLILYDAASDSFRPHLAHTWEIDETKTTYTFYLRKGVRFHHGKILTSEDVKATFERLIDENMQSPFRWQFESIDQVEIITDTAFKLRLKRPFIFLLHSLSSLESSILPSDLDYESHHHMPVGSGPFSVKKHSDEILLFEVFDDYFKERALMDRIEILFLPSKTSSSWEYELPVAPVDTEKSQVTVEEVGCRFMVFNLQKPGPQHDLQFRQAVCQLLDRKKLVAELRDTRFAPANSFFPEKSKRYHFPDSSLQEAKLLLDKSGYKGETVKLYYLDKPNDYEDAHWMLERANEIGLHLSLQPYSLLESQSQKVTQEADLLFIAEVMDSNLELAFLKILKDENSYLVRFPLQDQRAVLDRLAEQYMQEPSKSKREEIAAQIDSYMSEELFMLYKYHVRREKHYPNLLQGVMPDSYGLADFRKLWIKPRC